MLSIVIPAYNEESIITETITNVKEVLLAIDQNFEIIVVDNNSTDNTSDLAKSLGAKVFFEPENSIAKARNMGTKHASGDILIFIDADSKLSKKLVLQSLLALDEGLIAVSAISSLDKYPSLISFGIWLYNLISIVFKIGIGQFIMIRKKDFDVIGGFDETYYAFEELEFFKQLKLKYSRRSFKVLTIPVETSSRKFEKGKTDTTKFLLLLLAYFKNPKVGQDKKQLDFWYKRSDVQNSRFSRYRKWLVVFFMFLFWSNTALLKTNNQILEYSFLITPIIFFIMLFVIIQDKSKIKDFLLMFLITMIIEIVGVKTGFPFGRYLYDPAYASIGIGEVPIFIGFAWYILIVGISKVTASRVLSAIYIVILDLILEVFAVEMGIWTWTQRYNNILYAPIWNYISWGIIAFLLYPIAKKQGTDIFIMAFLLVVIIGYFSSSLIILGQPIIAIFGYMFCIVLVITAIKTGVNEIANIC
ncbi:carotenoid biosynthesis protein [bacterium]|nr:MAG: carotenoid biosynthesis protein [bacterium]